MMPAANSADSANRSAQVAQPHILNRGRAGFGSMPVLSPAAPKFGDRPPRPAEFPHTIKRAGASLIKQRGNSAGCPSI